MHGFGFIANTDCSLHVSVRCIAVMEISILTMHSCVVVLSVVYALVRVAGAFFMYLLSFMML